MREWCESTARQYRAYGTVICVVLDEVQYAEEDKREFGEERAANLKMLDENVREDERELLGLFVLDHTLKLYVPSERRGQRISESKRAEWLNRVLVEFAQWFGGATSADAKGAWTGTAGLVLEDVTIVQSFGTKDAIRASLGDVLELARDMKKALDQDAVSLEYDNRLYLI